MIDADCICHGNWRKIVKEAEHLLGAKYKDREGTECIFYGIVHGSDDYYYGMWEIATGKSHLLSCVGSIEDHGYTPSQKPCQGGESK